MRWLLTSWGSFGDLHPFLALGRELIARGHEVTLVGHPGWAEETRRAGLRFVAPDEPARGNLIHDHPSLLSWGFGGLTSLRTLLREKIAPLFDPFAETLLREAPEHDVLVANQYVYPAAGVAAIAGIPSVIVGLAPGATPSAYGLPCSSYGRAGPGFFARLHQRMTWTSARWFMRLSIDPPVNALRGAHGLAPVRDAAFNHRASKLHLQLYSELFAPRPPDWGPEVICAGFCPYDPPGSEPDAELESFLAAGPAPVLVTLGTCVVDRPGEFFQQAAQALQKLGLRGILLVGAEEHRPPGLPATTLAVPYAPFGWLMPQVRAVVHQCGIGTISHVLRAGLPSVACPVAFDQPNNARRLEALGVAEVVVPWEKNKTLALEEALQRLLAGDAVTRARHLGEELRGEDGVARACDLLEAAFPVAAVRDRR